MTVTGREGFLDCPAFRFRKRAQEELRNFVETENFKLYGIFQIDYGIADVVGRFDQMGQWVATPSVRPGLQ